MAKPSETRTGGRPASTGVIPGRFALSVGMPDRPAPTGWRWTALAHVARLETGHTPSRRHPEYWGGDVPWIGIKDATENHGRVIYDTHQHTNELGIANSSARILPAHSVCLSRTASVGYVVVMGRPMATSQDFVNWVCSESIDYQYLKYVLLGEREAFLRFASGTTHQTIYFPEVKAFHVCLPPIREQGAIGRILGTLDDKIELNRRMNETLEAMAQALFKSWFVDFDPIRAKAEGRDPRLPRYLADQFPDSFEDSQLGEIPTGWRAGDMGDLMEVSRNGISPCDFPDETFDHFSIPAFDEERQAKAANGASIKSNKFLVPPGVVLLSKLNPRIPRIWLPDLDPSRRAVCSTEFLVVLPKADTTREFLFCLFGSEEFATVFAALVTGTSGSHQRVRPEGLAGMRIIVPERRVIQEFTRLVRPLFERRSLAVSECRTLSTLRDTLLPKLISGELRAHPRMV